MCKILRKFDINSLYTFPPHLHTVATLPWEIQKFTFQQYYSFILQIIDVISKENKWLLHYPLHLKNVAPLPCKICTNSSSFSFFHVYQVLIRYTDKLRNGSVLLRYGLNFSTAWWTIQLISGDKDWKHVSVQKWSLWTFAVTLLAWHSICHTSQPVLFRATNANPQPAFLQPPTFGGTHIPSVRWKCCAFYRVVLWHFSGVVDNGVTVCFLLR